VWPITSTPLTYAVSTQRVSMGPPQLDEMLGGGVYRGSTVFVSGSAGTGKTTLAASAVAAACARGESALFVSFEESPDQIIRNMRSVGIDLGRWVDDGLLRLWGERATAFGLEAHLAGFERLLEETEPSVAVLDAVGSLHTVGAESEVTSAVVREVDMIKSRGTTAILSSLTHDAQRESSSVAVSSVIDTWLLLRNVETDGERDRLLFVMKSRGMAHSNQVREFLLTDHGAALMDVSVGARGVLTGSARLAQAAEERTAAADRTAELERRRMALAQRSAEVDAEVAALRAQLATESAELDRLAAEESRGATARAADRESLARRRESGSDDGPPGYRDG
jgi:circadian clock protein KaiC